MSNKATRNLATEKNIKLAAVGMTRRRRRKLNQSGAGKTGYYHASKLVKDWYPVGQKPKHLK